MGAGDEVDAATPGLGALTEVLDDRASKAMKRYIDLLSCEGIDWGLIGPRERPRLVDRHVVNSLVVSQLVPDGAWLADVGSGAGLPGIPLAIARPDLRVTLVEPLERRVKFLELAVGELDLGSRVQVLRERAENVHDTFDVVTCRAVAKLPKLLGWTSHLFLPDGELLAIKGESAADEVAASKASLRSFGCDGEVLRPALAGQTAYVVRVRRAR